MILQGEWGSKGASVCVWNLYATRPFTHSLPICGRKGVFEAIVGPNKRYALIGAIVIETLDLIVEPRSLQIYPNPRSKLPLAEIE